MVSYFEYNEKYFYKKYNKLKDLKNVKTKDLVTRYLLFFVFFVDKIIEKNEDENKERQKQNEEKRKELIKQNVLNIKNKLKEKQENGCNLQKETIFNELCCDNILVDEQNKNNHINYLTKHLKNNNLSHTNYNNYKKCKTNYNDKEKNKSCNISNICNDLTCAFYLCIILFLENLKDDKKNLDYKKCVDDNISSEKVSDEKDNNIETIHSVKVNENNNNIIKNLIVDNTNDLSFNLIFYIHLLYISLCFYYIYLLNDDIFYLQFSLLLFLMLFTHFKNKEIIHFIHFKKEKKEKKEKCYVTYEISISKFLYLICKNLGVYYKEKENDIYMSIFFLTYSFVFLKYTKKKNNEKKTIANNKILMDEIIIVQHMYEIFLDINFFSTSTFFILRTIQLHLQLLKNYIDDIKVEEQGGEEKTKKKKKKKKNDEKESIKRDDTHAYKESEGVHILSNEKDQKYTKLETNNNDNMNNTNDNIYNTNDNIYNTNDNIYNTNDNMNNTNDNIYNTNDNIYNTNDNIYNTNDNIYNTNDNIYNTNDNIYNSDISFCCETTNNKLSINEKVNRIIDMFCSLYNNINECGYIFLDVHLLSIYEYLVWVCFYIVKDVFRLCCCLKKEKEKRKILEYKYMTYRNLLEVYIIYLKYNYLNYSQINYSVNIYKNIDDNIYTKHDKMKNIFDTLKIKDNSSNEKGINHMQTCEEKKEKKENNYNFLINGLHKKAQEQIEDQIFIYDYKYNTQTDITIILNNVINMNEIIYTPYDTCKSLFEKKKKNICLFENKINIYDKNIIYDFIYGNILKDKNYPRFYNEEEKEEEEEEEDEDEKEKNTTFMVNSFYENMCFFKFFEIKFKEDSQIVKNIIHIINKKKDNIIINIDTTYFEEFVNIFQFDNIPFIHFNFYVCNFYSSSQYHEEALKKIKKIYKMFCKHRDNKEYVYFLQGEKIIEENMEKEEKNNQQKMDKIKQLKINEEIDKLYPTEEKKKKNILDYKHRIHYLCYNYNEILYLFEKMKKYKKKSLEYFSLFKQTTLHLDILINSMESYFYFNFFTKSFDIYLQNYMEIINSLSHPLKYLQNDQYLPYKREITLKCALLLKDIFICKKFNTFNENIHLNEKIKNIKTNTNIKTNGDFDDNISGTLTSEQKHIILQIVQFYFSFLSTYYKKENDMINEKLFFENNEEKQYYFDIYFYVCKTLSTVEDRFFISQAIQHYQYILNYSLKNQMYEDESYNEYMKTFTNKSIYSLTFKMKEMT
ncbi:conserved Plasmodium membrane protein, unknown function [Plasmodium sp. gorilla clade G3]|nr:conserved Plasmodium membrane protein, unknown function [Plasmodium sp. gorilla clade G3]